jgi:predicted PurR-regulated permease PerM
MNGKPILRGRAFFFGIFALLALMVLYLLSPFMSVILVSLVTAVMVKPLYDYYLGRKWVKNRARFAVTLTLITFFLIIIIPIFIIGFLLFSQSSELLDTISTSDFEFSLANLATELEEFLQQLPALSDIEISSEKIAQTLIDIGSTVLGWLADLAISLGTSLPSLFIGAIIFLVVVASLLLSSDDLYDRSKELSPLDIKITQIYFHKGREMIVSVIKGVFLLAVIQGAIMGVFYWLAGVPFTIFFTLLSMVFAILPVVGISFIVLPMALIFLLSGNVTSAVLVLIGFYIFVNPTDLTLRPRLISKEAYLNFTLMLLALFGGLALGGLLGMIYGPVIMILFITTIEIYAEYFTDKPDSQSESLLEGGQEEPGVATIASASETPEPSTES